MKQLETSGTSSETRAPWQIVLIMEDDALEPVVERGGSVVVDCSDRELIDGAIYAVRESNQLRPWLFHEGFAGQGSVIGGRRIGTLSSLGGGFRCKGPVPLDKILVVGKVMEPADTADALQALQREREALIEALESARATLRQLSGTTPAIDLAERNGTTSSITRLTRRFEEAMQDDAQANRFAVEQRIDAIGSRLMYIEERIADAEIDDAAGARTKLQVLWDLHYAPFPGLQNDLSARFISSTLRGLGRAQGQIDDLATSEPSEKSAGGGRRSIQLVSSPRRR